MITSRCEIGNGAIIAGGSVVVNSVPPYAVVGGNPAKIIKYRFDKEIQEKLENIQWYTWTIDEVLKHSNELSSIVQFDMNKYLTVYNKRKKSLDNRGG